MASALRSAREHLICSLCKKDLNEPKTIICLHSFCKTCLTDHITENTKSQNKTKGFECPICKKVTYLSEFTGHPPEKWSDMIPTNEALSNILTALTSVNESTQLSCPRHSDKEVEFFCEEHEIFACALCCNQAHKTCRRVNSLPDAVNVRRDNVKTLSDDLAGQIEETEKILNNRQDQIEMLESKEEDIKHELTEIKQQFNDFFSQMETKILDAMAEIKHKESGLIQLEINQCHQLIKDASDAVKQMKNSIEIKNPIVFVEKYMEHLKAYEERQEKLNELFKNICDVNIKYIANREIEKTISEANNIGSLSFQKTRSKISKHNAKGCTPGGLDVITENNDVFDGGNTNTTSRSEVSVSVGTTANEESDSEEDIQKFKTKDEEKIKSSDRDMITLFKARFIRDFSIVVDRQTQCVAEGAVILTSGHIMVTDSVNKCLKLFDKSYNYVTMIKFSVSPGDIAALSEKEVVVCLPETSRIKHARIDFKNKKISAGEILPLGDKCISLSYDRMKLACCSSSTVYVFQRRGNAWTAESTINVHVNNLKFVALDAVAQRLFVSRDGYPNKSVICMNLVGTKLWSFTHEEIRLPRGIVTQGNKVLVAVLDQKSIIQLNGKDGRLDGVVYQNGLQWPWNLCISPKGDKLLLSQNHYKMGAHDKNKILIFRLQKSKMHENADTFRSQ